MDYVVGCSGGNDSIALIQFMLDAKKDFCVLYNDTGWARDDWPARIAAVSNWLLEKGVPFYVTRSEGMEALVRRKKGWPMPASKMQFCTHELKEKPTNYFLNRIDREKEMTFVTGRRREESQNRADLPQWQDESPKHGGRECWNPLFRHTEEMRNELIAKSPFDILPHSSMECYPCVCANKCDLSELAKDHNVIDKIEEIEISMGFTRNGKPRTMFRPYRVGGGVGIRQAVEWGSGPRGWKAEYVPDTYIFKGNNAFDGVSDIAYEENTKEGREFARQCDGGFCGS